MWVWICKIYSPKAFLLVIEKSTNVIDPLETDLSSVLNTTVCDPKGMNCPIQIECVLRILKRQALSQGSLVNLNSSDTNFLEILNLTFHGKSNLVAGFRSEQQIIQGTDKRIP